jgi:hypothetical protein
MMRSFHLALVAPILFAIDARAGCKVEPDQSFMGPAQEGVYVYSLELAAQSFTPLISGVLDLVAVYAMYDGPVVFTAEIHATDAGVPTGPALATSVLSFGPTDLVEEWIYFDFLPENYSVTSGSQIAVVIQADVYAGKSTPILGVSAFGDPYPGGVLSTQFVDKPWFSSPDYDMLFQTTVCVGTIAVESATWGGLKALYR